MPDDCLLIFDLDDTLISSGQTWTRAEMRLFALLGGVYDPRVVETYKGMNAWDIGQVIHAHLQPEGIDARECGRVLRAYLLDEVHQSTQEMPGADALVRLAATHLPLAVASGSPQEVIDTVLAQHGWTDSFHVLVSSEHVAHGKPAPDVFLAAAEQAGCAPARTLVIEDSLNGVLAAKRAGMTCYAVPSSDDPRIVDIADRSFPTLDAVQVALRHLWSVRA